MSAIQQALLATAPTGGGVPRTGLVAEYLLATNSLDTSGNGYNGTDWGTTSYASNSLVLNGAGAILIDDNVPVRLLGNYTYSVWANTSVNSGAYRLVNKDKAIDFSGGYALFIIDGQYFIQHIGGGFESCGYTFVSVKPNSEWHNFMVIFNGTSVKFYIDNVEVYSTATTQTLGFQADAKLMLGSYGSSAPNGQLFQGNMKKVRFYDRALNAGERAALYAEG